MAFAVIGDDGEFFRRQFRLRTGGFVGLRARDPARQHAAAPKARPLHKSPIRFPRRAPRRAKACRATSRSNAPAPPGLMPEVPLRHAAPARRVRQRVRDRIRSVSRKSLPSSVPARRGCSRRRRARPASAPTGGCCQRRPDRVVGQAEPRHGISASASAPGRIQQASGVNFLIPAEWPPRAGNRAQNR